MSCQKCASPRIFSVYAKCSDLCTIETNTRLEHDGYVPQEIGISTDSDAVNFDYCIDCGQIQGTFPINFSGKFGDDEDDLDVDEDTDEQDKKDCIEFKKNNPNWRTANET
jgi:hypothetical protein